MGAGRGGTRCALWGGLSLGAGTLAFALFSPSSVGCSTNVVVLTRSVVTARGCAAYSVVAHVGVGLMVLGAVLLLGSFALVVRTRRLGALDAVPADAPDVASVPVDETARGDGGPATPIVPVVGRQAESGVGPAAPEPVATEPAVAAAPGPATPAGRAAPAPGLGGIRSWPIAPGEDVVGAGHAGGGVRVDEARLADSSVRLPPGWYGNPNNPGKPIQWWDGTRLTDGPG